MKRFFLILFVICLALAGCNTDPFLLETVEDTWFYEAEDPTETTQAPVLIGFCIRERSAYPEYYDALEQSLTQAGYQLIVKDCHNDQSFQNSYVQSMVKDGCTLILSEPVMTSAQDEVIRAVSQAQIPLLLLNYQPDDAVLDSYAPLAYIGYDPAQPGILQAQSADLLPDGGDLNGDGKVSYAIIAGPEDYKDTHLQLQGARLDSGELLATEYTDRSIEEGRAACGRLLAKFGPELEVILCGNRTLTLGALQATEANDWQNGRDGYLLGLDNHTALLSEILQGTVSTAVIPDIQTNHTQILDAVASILAGIPTEKLTHSPYVIVTLENAAEYLP